MKCPKCGAALTPTDKFCPHCRNPVTAVPPQTIAKDEKVNPPESERDDTISSNVNQIDPKPKMQWLKWVMLSFIVLLILAFALYKMLGPSVSRAEAAIENNRFDEATEILNDLKGERATALLAYVNYHSYIREMNTEYFNISEGHDSDGSSLRQIMSGLEKDGELWGEVLGGRDSLNKKYFSMAEHNHQVMEELVEELGAMENDLAFAHEDMVKMVQGVDYVRGHVQNGVDGIEDSFKIGEERTLMEECRQAGERLAPIIEKWTSLTIKPDYDDGLSEVSGELAYSDVLSIFGGNDFEALFDASTYTYDFVRNHKDGGSDDDMVYYIESVPNVSYLTMMSFCDWNYRFGKEAGETVEDLDTAIEKSLNLIRDEAVIKYFSQLQMKSDNN